MPDTPDNPMQPLRLTRKEEIADGIVLFDFRRRDGAELPAFTAGSHVTIRTPNGLDRKFSLCNDPAERHRYLVAIKKEASGRGGSINLIDATKEGDELPVSAPVNDFGLPPRGDHFIFIAGGIGITPMMSMIHHLKATPGKNFRLYYLTRSRESTAFLDELSAPEFKDKVVIHHDGGDPSKALDLWPAVQERKNREHLYCCGPRALMEAVRAMTGHWTSTSVHFEAFSEADTHKADDKPFTVRIGKTGETFEVPADKTILEVMRARGHQVPSSCETGTCGTCRTKLVSGEADHRDLVLTEQEKSSQIMICVSRAKSTEIVIDR